MTIPRIIPVAGAAVALAIGAAGCGNSTSANSNTPKVRTPAVRSAQASSGPATVHGTVSEWAVKVTPDAVPAGKVTFDVTNSGKIPHEFVILRTGKSAADLGTGTRIPETGNVGETGDIAAGASKSVTLDLKPGHYSIVCNLPAHYKMGMHTDFTVS